MQLETKHDIKPANDQIDLEAENLAWLEASCLDLLSKTFGRRYGKPAIVSSFGAQSALMLYLVAKLDKNIPVLFVDTQMMFQETLDYQTGLAEHLGLGDIRIISADDEELRRNDTFGRLHLKDSNACCHLRKVEPLERALADFDCWVSGRRRTQAVSRGRIAPIERDAAGRIKINPLAHWLDRDVKAAFKCYDLPSHPLVEEGFTSIGCAPCTARPLPGSDPRSGRWAGNEKTECGIHFSGGKIVRKSA